MKTFNFLTTIIFYIGSLSFLVCLYWLFKLAFHKPFDGPTTIKVFVLLFVSLVVMVTGSIRQTR